MTIRMIAVAGTTWALVVAAGCTGGGNDAAGGTQIVGDAAADVAAGGATVHSTGCSKDTDCKGSRICERGACVDPPNGDPAGGSGGAPGGAGGALGSEGGSDAGVGGAGPLPSAGVVSCGDVDCDTTNGGVCCYQDGVGLPPIGTSASLSCETECSPAQISLGCDGAEDCATGETCCRVPGGTLLILPTGQPGFVCTADCADGKPVECGGPDACPNGQTCCGAVEGGTLLSPARLTSTACASDCPDGVVLCRSDADCGGGSCTETSLLEGFSTCE